MVHMMKEIMEQPVVLEKCANNNYSVIKDIIKTINKNNINFVYIAARGTSDHAAVYGKYLIELMLGIPVGLAAPSIFTMYGKSLNLKNSLVIGISQSGKAADVLEVLKAANSQGALTVSITNFADSPLALEAKFHLNCSAGEEKSVAATKTFTTQAYLLAQLTAEWLKNEEIKKQLQMVPESISKMFETSDLIDNYIQRYRFINECFVLARGLNYSIALETALKIQETAYVRAKAYATSDFYHGPFAMVEKDMPFIVFAPKGPSFKDTGDMLHKLKENNVELIIVSNDKQTLEMGECALSIPDTENDMISPFYNVVTAQIFACKLALTKGLNPDSPRGLNKVTITR